MGSGAVVSTAIVDAGARLGPGATVGRDASGPVSAEDIALVGAGVEVDADDAVPPGARLDPSDDAAA